MNALEFDNRFVNELTGDPQTDNIRRQVYAAHYSLVAPTPVSAPYLVSCSSEAASLIDWSTTDCQSAEFVEVFSGNRLLDGMQPHAMNYGGHQFGNWAGQLGDGRAINLGEVKNRQGKYWTLQLKGAGQTPYSRTADGLAVMRSSVREYLCSEAMHYLGVPTTRALCLLGTGEKVVRDMFYDGHPQAEPGAIVCRMAPTFIRFGNFQLPASRKEYGELKALTDFTIRHYFPALLIDHEPESKALYQAWFETVCQSTAVLMAHWMRVGFVHGVMNTDNMSILGLTIDYGPYGWLDTYEPDWIPNTTDAHGKRYRYSQQPNVALWNLYQLANAIYPLIEDTTALEAALEHFQQQYQELYQTMRAEKLGFAQFRMGDDALFNRLDELMQAEETDMTLLYRALAGKPSLLWQDLQAAFYQPKDHSKDHQQAWNHWLVDYQQRLTQDGRNFKQRQQAMNAVNPAIIFRNYMAQEAIDLAEQGDFSRIDTLLEVLRRPYQVRDAHQMFAEKRPEWAKTKAGCSMLSCSS